MSSSVWSSDNSSETADNILGNEFKGNIINDNNDNKYIIIYKLGCGSFSSVWLSYSLYDKQLVAIKIYHPKDYSESLREIEIYDKINKSNINKDYLLSSLNIFEIEPIITNPNYYNNDDTINKHNVIVLPLMAISTYDLLDYYEDGLDHKIILIILKQLFLGLMEFEKINLCHTDLKPENILLCGRTYKMEYIENYINTLNLNIQMDDEILQNYCKLIQNKIEDYDNDDDDNKGDMIIDKYLDNINIKLCDFNLSIEYNKIDYYDDYQTRYYRSPEIILGYKLHKKSDYWSIPCIIFELLTCDILFDPKKTDKMTTDMAHLYLIIELLGDIPEKMIKNSPNYKILFNKNKIKGIDYKIKNWKLNDVILEYDLKNTNELKILINIMNDMLIINPEKRYDLNYFLTNYLN